MTKILVTVMTAALAIVMSGCSQKRESISFDEALKKDLLSFEYRMIHCAPDSRRTVFYKEVPTADVPSDLQFTKEEAAVIGLDRGPRGQVVRISAKRPDGRDVALEAEMDDSRVYTGTTLVRGREGFVYSNSDLVRHVGPRLQEMLRQKSGE